MSSDSEDDLPPELKYSTEEVMRAKETNPGMFVSAWQADEEDISYWSKKDLKSSDLSQLLISFIFQKIPKNYLFFLVKGAMWRL